MSIEGCEQDWRALSEEVILGMQGWRLQHPRATGGEIEAALDERLAQLRARMMQDMAPASAACDREGESEAPRCRRCGAKLKRKGQGERPWQTVVVGEATPRRYTEGVGAA